MRRADRLFQIVQFLRGGRLTTAAKLAETLEVSERTIYRDISDLIGSGVPIEGEAGVGYVMRAGYDVPPLMFTKAEVAALVAGVRMVRSWGGLELAKAAEEARVKIESVLPQSLQSSAARVPIHSIDRTGPTTQDRALLDTLEAAIDASRLITFEYQDKDAQMSSRQVRPLGLYFWGKTWTLASWCTLRADFRSFRIDRIKTVETGAPFRPERGKTLSDFYAYQSRRPPST